MALKQITTEQADHFDRSSPAAALAQIGQRVLENRKYGKVFHKTVTITSAAAATAVEIIPSSDLEADEKIYLQGFIAKVNGGTLWATTATVKIQDNNGTPVDFVTIAVAALTGNAVVIPATANVTLEDAYAIGTGGTAGKGLQLKGNANGTGSDLKVTVWGVIK